MLRDAVSPTPERAVIVDPAALMLSEMQRYTIETGNEVAGWGYCDITTGDLVRVADITIGTQDEVYTAEPAPLWSEVPCLDIHTHPHHADVAPGPSGVDLDASLEVPGLPHVVIDKYGFWVYVSGDIVGFCPPNGDCYETN